MRVRSTKRQSKRGNTRVSIRETVKTKQISRVLNDARREADGSYPSQKLNKDPDSLIAHSVVRGQSSTIVNG